MSDSCVVVDKTSNSSSPGWYRCSLTPYIQITGVLAYNSNITIEGGSYIVPQRFVNCPSGLAIQDGSTILIEGGTYDMQIDSTRGTSLFVVGDGLTIMNGSSVTITSNTLVSSNIDAPAFWNIRILYTYGSSPTTISDRSSTSIIDNVMAVNDISTMSQWYWYIIDFSTTNNGVTVSNSSSVMVDGNTMVASNVSVILSNGYVYGLAAAVNVQLTITHSSTMSFSNNNVSITNMSIYGHTYYSMISLSASSNHIVVSESSQLWVSYNNFLGEDITSRTWRVITMSLGGGLQLNVSESSTATASYNGASLVRVVGTLLGFGETLAVMAGTILGTLEVARNVFQIHDDLASVSLSTVNIGSVSSYVFNLVGTLVVKNNSNTAAQYSACTSLRAKSSIPTSPIGLLFLTGNNNSVCGTNSHVLLSDETVNITPTVYVCGNTVNSTPCIPHTTAYDCATPTLTFSNLTGCIPTPTPTSTATVSGIPPGTATPTAPCTRTTTLILPPTPTLTPASTPTSPVKRNTNTVTNSHTDTIVQPLLRSVTLSYLRHPTSTNTIPPPPIPTNTVLVTTTPTTSISEQQEYLTASLPPTPTPTPSTTLTPPLPPSLPPPACNFSCADVVSMEVVPAGVTAAQAIGAYWSSHDNATAAMQGCTPVRIPFDATFKGASALLLVRVGVGVNTTYPTGNVTFATSTVDGDDNDLVAVGASGTVGEGGVVVVWIRRVDASPLSSLSGTMTFPAGVLMCTPTATSSGPFVNIELEAPPTALGENERIAIAAVSMASADLQTVAAIGLLRCTPGSDEDVESEAGVRALVPIALSGTCAGAVQGALVGVCVALLLSVTATCVVRAVRGVGWAQAAATTRCPSLMLSVWGFLQMGFVVCGARLLTAESGSGGGGGGGDAVLGGVGVVVGGVLPGVYVLLAWSVVSRRCYRLAQVPGAVAGRHGAVVWARGTWLPSYELDSDVYPASRAHSVVVGRTRRASPLWAGLSVIQPVVMLLVVFVQGSPCNVMLIVAGVVLAMVGCVHAVFRPHRVVGANYLQCVAMLLNACILFVASSLVRDPLNIPALDSNRAFAMLQVGLSVCRLLLSVGSFVYMRLYRKTVFTRANPDGLLPREEAADSLPTPVFDVRGRCGGEMVLPLDVPPQTNDALDTGLLTKSKPKTNMKFSDAIMSTAMKDFVPAERPNVLEEAHSDLEEELPTVPHQGAAEGSGSGSTSTLSLDDTSDLDDFNGEKPTSGNTNSSASRHPSNPRQNNDSISDPLDLSLSEDDVLALNNNSDDYIDL